jgi:putative nucleotidyltransferase with HDIG domain
VISATYAIRRRIGEWCDRESPLLVMQIYLRCVIAAGVGALVISIGSMLAAPPDLRWIALAVLTVASSKLMMRMPVAPVSFSISEIFTFTTALMFGPAAGAVVVAVEAAVLSTQLVQDKRSLTRYLFNLSAAALAMAIAARAFFALSQTTPLAADPSVIIDHLGSLTVFAVLYFVLNTGLVALAVSLANQQAVWRVWRTHFLSLWPGYLGGASAAGLTLFLVSARNGDLRVLGLVLPIPLILYVAFRTAIARMQDNVAHLTRVNSMYLATIETLAQAVDARDQVTHDHIRRVQKNAMRLASELNIHDEAQLRALEAAALLHDTGKLAIPEHILNKPDKLTAAEFETMKQHSRIGAEILSSIEFPFPLVPIVRHHHENWDGSGYPDGLRGEDIPIGARILSVVDCFDALTSDRPYRRAVPVDKALGIIRERRNTMYDPAVVDAMIRISTEIAREPSVAPDSPRIAEVIAQARPVPKFAQPSDPAITAITVNMAGQLGEIVGRERGIEALCEALGDQLSVHIPGLTLVIYQYDQQMDALFARAASGVHKKAVQGLAIAVGLRLTGWVGAHRTTIVNSEAALDLGNIATQLRPLPQLCLSTPLTERGRLVGVLTVYSTLDRPFLAADVALFEMLAALTAPIVAENAHGNSVPNDAAKGESIQRSSNAGSLRLLRRT